MNRSLNVFVTNQGGTSGLLFNIPNQPGLILKTDPTADLGLKWCVQAPASITNNTTQVTGSNVTCGEQNLTTSFRSKLTNIQNVPVMLNVSAMQISKMVSLRIANFSGTLSAQKMQIPQLLCDKSRPPYRLTFTCLILNGGVKQLGVIEIDTDGTINIWPSVTKNNGEWALGGFTLDNINITWHL